MSNYHINVWLHLVDILILWLHLEFKISIFPRDVVLGKNETQNKNETTKS